MANFKKIDQVLDLAHRTGDKIIIVSEWHDPYVIMSVREYESLLHGSAPVQDMSEDQLLDKINRDIAVWKASQEEGTALKGYDLDKFRVDASKDESAAAVVAPVSDQQPGPEPEEESVDEKYYLEPVD